MQLAEVMKLKRALQASCSINAEMLDFTEEGYVLCVERTSINPGSYKLLADFAEYNKLNLQLDNGNFILSNNAVQPH